MWPDLGTLHGHCKVANRGRSVLNSQDQPTHRSTHIDCLYTAGTTLASVKLKILSKAYLSQLLCRVAAIGASHGAAISPQVARKTKALAFHACTVLVTIVRASRCHGAEMPTIAPITSTRTTKTRTMAVALPIWPTLWKITQRTNPARVAKALAMHACPMRSTFNTSTYSCK